MDIDTAYLLGRRNQMDMAARLERQISNFQKKCIRNHYNKDRKWLLHKALRENIDVLYLIKIKNYYSSKITIRRVKIQK